MFGFKKLQNEIVLMRAELNLVSAQVAGHTKEFHTYSDRGISVLKLCQDTKVDISSFKIKLHDLSERVEWFSKECQGVLKKTCDMMIELNQNGKDRTAIMQEFVKKQDTLIEYIKQLEPLLSNVEMIIEECLPKKPVPKLPKTKKATTDRT